MLTDAQIALIESVKNTPDHLRNSKKNAIAFRDIRNSVTGEKNTNCMCGMVYRKIYIKDFFNWYEEYTR